MGALPEPQLTEPLHVFTLHTIHLGQNSNYFVLIPVIIERRQHKEVNPRGQFHPLPVDIAKLDAVDVGDQGAVIAFQEGLEGGVGEEVVGEVW